MNVPGRFSGQFIVWCDVVVFRRKARCTRSYNTALWTSPDHSLLWSQFQHLSFHFSNIKITHIVVIYHDYGYFSQSRSHMDVKLENPCQCSAACLVRCGLCVSICSSPLSIVFTKCESLEPGPHSSYCQGKNWIQLIFTTQATVRHWERVTQEWGHVWPTQSLSSTSQEEVCCASSDVFVVVSSEQVCG